MIENITQFLDKKYAATSKTHQLLMLFERYKNMNKDLVEEYQKQYSRPINLIVSALYTADYILTSSEVKFELEDSDRRKEIIEFWATLTLQNDEMWYEITNLVAFAYDSASILRKRYYHLLDRGVAKHIAASLVADYYTRHVLEFISSKGGFIPLWWVTYLLDTALCQTIFSKTLQKWSNRQDILHSRDHGILANIIASHFTAESEGEPNPAVPVPYFNDSSIFYYMIWGEEGAKKERFDSIVSGMKIANLNKEFKKYVPHIGIKAPHILKYLRNTVRISSSPTPLNFFVVHAKTEIGEGWIGLVSPLDDINLKEIEALLQLKLLDMQSFDKFKSNLPAIEVLQRIKEEREKVVEKIEQEEKGFFAKIASKITSLFKKSAVSKPVTIAKAQPLDTWSKLFLDEILMASVSGVDLGLEIYDTYREDNFVISGVIESEQKEIQPTVFYSEKSIDFPSEFLDPIIYFISISKIFISASARGEIISIIPEEALYQDKIDTERTRLVEFVFAEKLLVGLLAEKYSTVITTGEPTYQRRSILRKANEMQKARRVNNMIDVGKRTISREINWDTVNQSYEEKPLFFLKK
ncbi:MAG: hypothetical protein ACFFDS_01650 [Candidatus Thorarchaeota archaeon]